MLHRLRIPRLIRLVFSTGIILLVLMGLFRMALFFFFARQGNSLDHSLPSFVLGFRYDLKDVAIILFPLLVLCSFAYFSPFDTLRGRKLWFIWFSILVPIMLLLYVLDFAYYDYLSQRLNANILNYLQDARISMRMVWQTYPVIWMIIGVAIMSWLVLFILRKTYYWVEKNTVLVGKTGRAVWLIITILLLGLGIFGRIGQYPLRWSDAFAMGNDYQANLSLNPIEYFFNTLNFRHTTYDRAAARKSYPLIANALPLPKEPDSILNFNRRVQPVGAIPSSRPNIVLVICESFSAYKSSMWGNPLNTTPFFDEMCKQGIFFDRCFTPSYGTARGVWAALTGIPDVQYPNTSSRNPLIVDQHTIINDFTGYDKYYFIGGSTSWANIRGLLSANISGLHLYEQENFDAPKIDVWGISDKNLFLEANKIFKQKDQPFFAVIQTADNHRPYSIPKEDLAAFRKIEFPKDSLTKYGFESNDEMNAFRYTDFCYQQFIEAARKEKYFDNTIFVFVGDHGIAGEAGHMFPRVWTTMRLDNMHVPLLFFAPKLISPKRYHGVCSQIDVLPTIAGLSRIPYNNTSLGRDLLDSMYLNNSEYQFSFMFDVDMHTIGIARNDYFLRKQLNGSRQEFVSLVNNDTIPDTPETEAIRKNMAALTDAFWQTSRYLLFNNKKPH